MRVAFLVYRGNPHCGGQGVYTRHLTRELSRRGPRGDRVLRPALPRARRGCGAGRGPEPRPLPGARPVPHPAACASSTARSTSLEFAIMCTGGFPEPLDLLAARRAASCAAPAGRASTSSTTTSASAAACSGSSRDGWPLVATIHHPITVDRDARPGRTPTGFAAARRFAAGTASSDAEAASPAGCPRVLTVSESSTARHRASISASTRQRVAVVPVGVDTSVFRPARGARHGARPDHDDRERRRAAEGPRAAPRGAREGAHRADRRPPRRRSAS